MLPFCKASANSQMAEKLLIRLRILDGPLKELGNVSDPQDEDAINHAYAMACLKTIKHIHLQLQSNGYEMGVKDSQMIETLFVLIMVWGMAPSLDAFSARCILDSFKQHSVHSFQSAAGNKSLLVSCAMEFSEIISDKSRTAISETIIRKYLSTIMLSIMSIQVNFASTRDNDLTAAFTSFLECLGSSTCMDALLSLVAPPLSTEPDYPSWLRKEAGCRLSKLILNHDGVLTLFSLLLPINYDGMMNSKSIFDKYTYCFFFLYEDVIVPTQLEQISRLLLCTPSFMKDEVRN